MAVTPVRPGTWTGPGPPPVVPLPSSPTELPPHAQTVPSDASASPVSGPAETAIIPDSPGTWAGRARGAPPDEPVPSCPSVLSPHVQSVPSERTAAPNLSPSAN